ncbi:MAG: M14 family metallopeptidase [Rhodothermales bacterium]
MRLRFSLLLAFLFVVPAAAQQLPFPLEVPTDGVSSFSGAIPTHEAVFGHVVGTRHTEPSQVVSYYQAVAAVSDRVTLHQHGKTHEGRPLIHAIVTSPANHARLEQIREANLRLSDSPGDVSDADLADMPTIAYMGYSVHGNEASGTEAALMYLYYLAAGQGEGIDAVLDNTVMILDPLFNPDGRDRFVDWANRNRGTTPVSDPQDREHREAWPGGRTNHYWFDLNRDWLPVQHPESKARITLFHHWRPQVLTDFHEMGGNATYFFQPGIPSRTNPNTPQRNQDLTGDIADFHARILDRIGALYYTRESFDDFYYGKGSTYPDVNGAIGILFEQASSRALLRDTPDGLLDYAYTVRNQFMTSISTGQAVVELRENLLRHQRDFYAEVPDFVRDSDVKGYLISTERGASRVRELVDVLSRHRVQFHRLSRDTEANGMRFRAGDDLIVSLDQPQGRFVKAVMERSTTFTDSLFYDVSAWTLPLAFDLDYAEVTGGTSNLVGDQVMADDIGMGQVVGGRSQVGYLLTWDRYYAPRALYKLQQMGVKPRLLKDPFSALVEGEAMIFERGTVFIPAQPRDATRQTPAGMAVYEAVQKVVAEDHVNAYSVSSGLTPMGPDLGGRRTEVLPQPKMALIVGSGTSAYNAGETWHLISHRFRMPISLLEADDVGNADLTRYNTIIMAGGFYGNVNADAVKRWVRSGGRLITLSSATDWAIRNEMIDLEAKSFDTDSLVAGRPYDEVSDTYGAQGIGGTIFNARLDVTHPIAYSMPETMPVFRNSSRLYEASDAPGTNVAVYTDDPLLSGYVSEERLPLVGGSATVVADGMGRGSIIAFTDNPNFRAFWYGTNRLFMNAVFFGSAF